LEILPHLDFRLESIRRQRAVQRCLSATPFDCAPEQKNAGEDSEGMLDNERTSSPPRGNKGLSHTFNQRSRGSSGLRGNDPVAVAVTERLDDEERYAIDRKSTEVVFSEPGESTRPSVHSRSVNAGCDPTRASARQ
jgi:hypothetical protein